ncbi:uncharacterized protein BJ212DRAFT_1349087 [Suillus subaureus]|uniref:Uncharacterized protein n=1 Tax=Suillus subaureus TaxID=48587 RepID=A0A9P7JEQ2_9AGAM|nr:uncharacterized protein BJ212DRAFT_1349087 [Suillus subaureus]KAG1818155.1 hypothetical protein BJ212DRAFT_1349087 [Suillus subaureus]
MSEESALSAILEEILQAHISSSNDPSYESAKAKLAQERRCLGRNSRMVKVLSYEKLVLVLALVLLPLGRHFRERREFSVVWLEKSIGTVMGTVDTTLEQATADGPEGAEAQKQIALWKTQITNSQGASDIAVFNDVFYNISNHAKDAFAHIHTDIGEKTGAYLDALNDYRFNIVKFLRAKWLEGSSDTIEADDIMRRYDRITARIAVWLSPQDITGNIPIPLLSAWLLDYAWSSLNAVKEGFIEICRWFEPLLDYYPFVRAKSHDMDDNSEVMVYNVVNHVVRIYAPDADLQLCHFLWEHRNTLIFHLHNTMSTISEKEIQQDRPKDIMQIDNAFDKLPGDEKQAFKQLVASVKNVSKGGLHCIRGSGAYAMRVTKWDWRNKTLKNSKRDIEPLVKAVFLELRKARGYRTVILADSVVAGLRKQLEDVLVSMMKPNFHIRLGGKFATSETWQWWDGIEIPKDTTPITSKLQQIQLEQRDQDAITDLVTYVEHMACAQGTTAKDSPLNSEVAKALDTLVHALKSSSTHLHNSSMAADPDLSRDIRAAVHLKIPRTKDHVDAKTTLESQISGPSSKRQRTFTVSGSPTAMKKRAHSSPARNSAISDDEDIIG